MKHNNNDTIHIALLASLFKFRSDKISALTQSLEVICTKPSDGGKVTPAPRVFCKHPSCVGLLKVAFPKQSIFRLRFRGRLRVRLRENEGRFGDLSFTGVCDSLCFSHSRPQKTLIQMKTKTATGTPGETGVTAPGPVAAGHPIPCGDV